MSCRAVAFHSGKIGTPDIEWLRAEIIILRLIAANRALITKLLAIVKARL